MRRPHPGPTVAPTRRDFLHVGAAGVLGLGLGDFLRLRADGSQNKAKAQALIHIFLPGGIAHQDTFDPKPNSPLEYRGELGVVPTKLEGEWTQISTGDAATCGIRVDGTLWCWGTNEHDELGDGTGSSPGPQVVR